MPAVLPNLNHHPPLTPSLPHCHKASSPPQTKPPITTTISKHLATNTTATSIKQSICTHSHGGRDKETRIAMVANPTHHINLRVTHKHQQFGQINTRGIAVARQWCGGLGFDLGISHLKVILQVMVGIGLDSLDYRSCGKHAILIAAWGEDGDQTTIF
ncbi:hypothetical protein Acr_00g0046640 [Actinidia rufa]|uniref:Uncharacterized protein n=1 Tax=Actinidia rufa TaxID=165716 RepID=A0A7J0DJH3_9ERIC|nr:hypothetical protein Acr_00g0046640 [Actinidia rufa]